MATVNMGYDHPAYTAHGFATLGRNTAGASAVSGRFVAWTTMQIASIASIVVTSGTSTTHVMRSVVLRNGGTSTDTAVLYTLGSGALSTGRGHAQTTLTLTAGDAVAVLQGTDATMVSEHTIEYRVLPGADVSAVA